MSKVTYKNLYTLVDDLIDERISYNNQSPYRSQTSRSGGTIAPLAMSSSRTADISANELVRVVQNMIAEAIPSRIIEGLAVTQTNPISSGINITAGKGAANGTIYTLIEDTQMTVPLDQTTHVFYVSLYRDTITFEKSEDPTKLIIAKIVCPIPQLATRVRNKYDESPDAYIQQYRTYNLYGDANGYLEEDSVEMLRDNIGEILADNLIGNIRLSENLKITNTRGTIELNSESLKLMDEFERTLGKFTRTGIYFYNTTGQEIAKFATDGARIGNISIVPNAIQSTNFVSGVSGFQLKDTGDVELNGLTVRGTVYATAGQIGGWSIASDSIYATTTGVIKTSANVGAGYNGVLIDKNGIKVYDDILGVVVNLPSDGSAPVFSSGTITSVTWTLNTSSVIRTSSTVGDGSASSAGILINNTGMYGCEANQTLANANFKVLNDGNAYFNGQIQAISGQIGSVSITETALVGGLISGATLQAPVIETSATFPRIRIDEDGMYYQVAVGAGAYAEFLYNEGTYGAGVTAYLMNSSYPVLSIMAELPMADIRLYNRTGDPASGTHAIGDIICVGGALKICTTGGSPGTFTTAGVNTFIALSDTPANWTSSANKICKVNSGGSAIEFGANLAHLADCTNLTDPGGDRLVYWRDASSYNNFQFIAPSDGIEISGGVLRLDDSVVRMVSNQSIGGYKTFAEGLAANGDIDFNQNEAVEMCLEVLTGSDPTTPNTGRIWFRSDV